MDFSSYLSTLDYKAIKGIENDKLSFLFDFKCECTTEDDYYQLYELKNLLEIKDFIYLICNGFEECSNDNYDSLYNAIEYISQIFEEEGVSCFSYSYYIGSLVEYLMKNQQEINSNTNICAHEYLFKQKWLNPLEFNYPQKDDQSTFGYNEFNENTKFVEAYPDINKFIGKGTKLIKYEGKKPYIIIPEKFKVIGSGAFENNKRVKTVIIPDTVTKIEDSAFKDCENINIVRLSKNIHDIGPSAFENCKKLKKVVNSAIETVQNSAFKECRMLSDINLDNLVEAHDEAFENCSKLTEFLYIPELIYIGDRSFMNCHIDNIVLNNCSHLGKEAFKGCLELENFSINNPIKEVGLHPFSGCYNLSSLFLSPAQNIRIVDLLSGVKELNKYDRLTGIEITQATPFICQDMSNLVSVKITRSTDIGESAFENCTNLQYLDFTISDVNVIGRRAFKNCSSLNEINFNMVGDTIGDESFFNCKSLIDFSFIDNVSKFGVKSLANCNLSKFNFYRDSPISYIGNSAFLDSTFSSKPINILLKNCQIDDYAFKGVQNINLLEIDNCNIEPLLLFKLFEFKKEDFLSNVRIHSLITDFDAEPYLFHEFNCDYIECNIKKDELPEGLFNNCKNLVNCKINGSITTIGQSAFAFCGKLNYIDAYFNNDLVIKENAFSYCTELNFTLIEKARIICDFAFQNSGLKDIHLTTSCVFIGDNAFKGCDLNSNVTLPFSGNSTESVKPFGTVFSTQKQDNCVVQEIDNTNYYIPKSINKLTLLSNELRKDNVTNVKCIEELYLPNIQELTEDSFYGCDSLKKIFIGKYLAVFSGLAFLTLPDSVEIIIDPENKKYVALENKIYSKDLKELYYSSDLKYDNNVKVISSFALNNLEGELKLSNLDELKSNCIDGANLTSINLSNIDTIQKYAINNISDLDSLSLFFKENKDYSSIISASKQSISLDRLVIDRLHNQQLINLFDNLSSLEVTNLSISNSVMPVDSLIQVDAKNLIMTYCNGQNLHANSIENLTLINCENVAELLDKVKGIKNLTIKGGNLEPNFLKIKTLESLTLNDVDTIKNGAFNGIKHLNKLVIHNVDIIESRAFSDCNIANIEIYDESYDYKDGCLIYLDKLVYTKVTEESFTIPNEIKTICNNSIDLKDCTSLILNEEYEYEFEPFYNSQNLKTLSLENISGDKIFYLFDNLDSLEELTFNGEIIPDDYFSNLTSLKHVHLSNNIKSIDAHAFCNDINLIDIENFEFVLNTGIGIFKNCSSLQEIRFNSDLETLGFSMFENCSSLTYLSIPLLPILSSLNFTFEDALGENLNPDCIIQILKGDVPAAFFKGDQRKIIITHGSFINSIGKNAFEDCKNLDVDLSNVSEIEEYAFKNAKLGSTLNLDKCIILCANAFYNAKGIKEVIFSKNLYSFDGSAFDGTSVESIKLSGENSKFVIKDNLVIEGNRLVYYAKNSTIKDICLPDEVESLDRSIFTNCENLITLDLNNVKNICRDSIVNCPKLKSIVFRSLLEKADKGIVNNCPELKQMTFESINGGDITCISDYFVDAENINDLKVVINSDVINENNFNEFNRVNSLHLKGNIIEIPNAYLKNMTNLKTLVIDNYISKIGDNAFENCTGLSFDKLKLNKLISLGSYAFKQTSINAITLPSSLKIIGEKCFEGCPIRNIYINCDVSNFRANNWGLEKTLETITFNNASFDSNSFENYKTLETITINNITNGIVPKFAFKGCESLTDFNCLSSLKEILKEAFSGCVSLTNFAITDSIALIDEKAFASTCLKEITLSANTEVKENAFAGCSEITKLQFSGYMKDFDINKYGFIIHKPFDITFENVDFKDGCFEDNEYIRNIIITGSCNYVGKKSFSGCTQLRNFEASNISTISSHAFEYCSNLNIDLTNTKNIEDYAFAFAKLPNDLDLRNCTYIGEHAFDAVSSIKNIVLSSSLNYVSPLSFANTNIESLIMDGNNDHYKVIDNQLIEDNELIFYPNNSNIASLTLAPEITSLQPGIISNCKKLKSLNLNNVKELYKESIKDCQKLVTVIFNSPLKMCNKGIISNCPNVSDLILQKVTYENVSCLGDYFNDIEEINGLNVTIKGNDISENDFAQLDKIKSITLNGDIKYIPNNYFKNLYSLNYLSLNSAILQIGDNAFENCSNLDFDTINFDSVVSFGKYCFKGTNIKSLIISPNVKEIGAGCFSESTIQNLEIQKEIKNFEAIDLGLKDNILEISFDKVTLGPNAFSGCAKLKNVNIDTLEDLIINDSAFKGCNNLALFNCNSGYKTICQNAFRGCVKLKKIEFPENLESIEENAFNSCVLHNITFKSAPILKPNSFCECHGLRKLKFLSNIKDFDYNSLGFYNSELFSVEYAGVTFKESCFENCKFLREIIISGFCDSISKKCFKNCVNLASFNAGGILNIEESAFEECMDIKLLPNIFNSTISIRANAFKNCSLIEKINLPVIKNIGKEAFAFNENLTDVECGDNLNAIGMQAFANSKKLTNINIGTSVKEIGDMAFAYTNVKNIIFPSSLNKLGNNIFEGISSHLIVSMKSDNPFIKDKNWMGEMSTTHKILRFLNPKIKVKVM